MRRRTLLDMMEERGLGKPKWNIEDGVLVKYEGIAREITVPDGVTSIADEAFFPSLRLEAVRIPDSVKSMGPHPFKGCHDLVTVQIPGHLLEGLTFREVLWLFTDEIMNIPSIEYRFLSRILDGTDKSSEAFRQIFLDRIRDDFYGVRWINKAIGQDKPQWISGILECNPTIPRGKLDECIRSAAEQGKAQIATILMEHLQNRQPDPEAELSLD